jgi:hypothetical protein
MQIVSQPGNFSNLQLELLKTFTHNLNEMDLIDLRKRLSQFFSDRLINQADKTWDNKEWSDNYVEELLNTKLRKKDE